jgi:hypothetical protein
MKNIFSARGRLCSGRIEFTRITRKRYDLGKTCQQTTDRKSRSGFQMKIFSPPGGVSVAIKIDYRRVTRKRPEICETSQKTTDRKSLSGFRMKIFLR